MKPITEFFKSDFLEFLLAAFRFIVLIQILLHFCKLGQKYGYNDKQ